MKWYSVRCIFEWSPTVYEERVLLWEAASIDEAIGLAEAEAHEYAQTVLGGRYLGLAQAYEIGERRPGSGDEVYSLIRTSDEDPESYLTRFFDTGTERSSAVADDGRP